MTIHFSDSYYIACVHPTQHGTGITPLVRRDVARALRPYLKGLNLKQDYRFPKTKAGLKAANARVKTFQSMLADFEHLSLLTIEQTEGFSMGF